MIRNMTKAKQDVPNGAEKTNVLQGIPESGEYEIYHPTPPHVRSRVDLTKSYKIMSRVLPSLRQELIQESVNFSGDFTKGVVLIKSAKKKTGNRSVGTILIGTDSTKVDDSYLVLFSGHVPIHSARN